MCGGSKNDVPVAPTPPARLPETPRLPGESSGLSSTDRDKRRRSTAAGTNSGTILTGSRGVTESAPTAKNLTRVLTWRQVTHYLTRHSM